MSAPARLRPEAAGSLRPARPSLLRRQPTAEEIEDERAAGYAAGYAEGLEAGRAEAEAEAERRRAEADASLGQAHWALLQATARARAAFEQTQDDLEALAIELAIAVAEAVVGRELDRVESPGADALRRALAEGRPRARAIVRLNPDDLAELPASAQNETEGLELVGDAELARGDCVVETAEVTIDARVAAQLARAAEVLRGEA
jgi:flagellar assembly protein FliH